MLLRVKVNEELFKETRGLEDSLNLPYLLSGVVQNTMVVNKERIDDSIEQCKQYVKILQIRDGKESAKRYANQVNKILQYIANSNKGKKITYEEFREFRNLVCTCLDAYFENVARDYDTEPEGARCMHKDSWLYDFKCSMEECPYLDLRRGIFW